MTVALWSLGGGAWHNVLFLIAAGNVSSWTDFANNFYSNEAELWQACETEKQIHGPAMGCITNRISDRIFFSLLFDRGVFDITCVGNNFIIYLKHDLFTLC